MALACGPPTNSSQDRAGPKTPPAPVERAVPVAAPYGQRLSAPLKVREATLLEEAISEFSTIRIRQTKRTRTMNFLSEDGSENEQTRMRTHQPHRLLHAYCRFMFISLLYRPTHARVLLVGLGGGAMVRFLRHHLPDVIIDAIELDPEVVRLAADWFGVVPGPYTNIVTVDGFDYIGRGTQRWDVVFMDTFLDPATKDTDMAGVPLALRTAEFMEQLRGRTKDDGLVVFNLHFRKEYPEHMAAIRGAFPHVRAYTVPGTTNRVVVASVVPPPGDDELKARARALDKQGGWGFSFSGALEHAVPEPPRQGTDEATPPPSP